MGETSIDSGGAFALFLLPCFTTVYKGQKGMLFWAHNLKNNREMKIYYDFV